MFSLAPGSLLNSQKKKKAYSTTIVKTHQAQKPCWSQNQSHSTADQKQPWCWLFLHEVFADPCCLVSMALFPLGLSPGPFVH